MRKLIDNVSLEAIDFQKATKELKELESIFETIILDQNELGKIKNSDLNTIDQLTFKRFGLRSKLRAVDYGGAYVYMFPVNDDNILFHDPMKKGTWRELVESESPEIAKDQLKALNIKGLKGTIDLKRAKLGGLFSTHEHFIGIAFKELIFNYKIDTARELLAVYLHEVGHAFTWYEYSNRVYDTNQVLQEFLTNDVTSNNPETYTYVLNDLKRIGVISKEDEKFVGESSDRKVFGLRLVQTLELNNKSFLADRTYNRTSSEQLADNFAVKLGYGDGLVTALNKLPSMDDFNIVMTQIVTLAATMFGAMYFLGVFILVTGIVSTLAIQICMGLMFAIVFASSGTGNKDFTYDDTKVRYSRIKHQMVQMLIQLNIPAKETKGLIATIKRTDELISNTPNHRSYNEYIKDLIFPTHRQAHNSVKEQQLLERLTSNDLFVNSAELKTLL